MGVVSLGPLFSEILYPPLRDITPPILDSHFQGSTGPLGAPGNVGREGPKGHPGRDGNPGEDGLTGRQVSQCYRGTEI